MIAIGGVIGAGLFVGSGTVIKNTGPMAFLTYAMTGVLIIMVMRMLGEMATSNPSTGSFSDYSRAALGNWAGFSTAWLYWYFWVVVVGFEAVAGATVLGYWLPDIPLWLMSLILMILMTATNLFSVSSFGEFEYWFASIKVFAIISFLILGTLYVFGVIGGNGMDFSNLTDHGGAFPLGFGAIFSGIVTVIFSMVGAEIATIAAAESKDPARSIAKATNSVITRIAVFFVGSIFLLTVMMPWNSTDLAASPFVSAFKLIGIPGIEHVMNAVVLTAVLSCLNSGLYTASRMLFVLAARREAPVGLLRVNSRGVPVWAILGSSVIGFLCVIAAYISPETVFSFLLNSSGAVILFVYILIGISQIILRRRHGSANLPVKMWGFPVLSIITVVAMIAVLVAMAIGEDSRSQLVLSLLAWAFILAAYFVTRARGKVVAARSEAPSKPPVRVLILANDDTTAADLREQIDLMKAQKAAFRVVIPTNPVDTGRAEWEGAAFLWQATESAAKERLASILEILKEDGVTDASGHLGDYRPWRALDKGVRAFEPDAILIISHPGEFDSALHHDTETRARGSYKIPVYCIRGRTPVPAA